MKDLTFYVVSFTFLFCIVCISIAYLTQERELVINVLQFEYPSLYDVLKKSGLVHSVVPIMNKRNELDYLIVKIPKNQIGFNSFYREHKGELVERKKKPVQI